MWVEVLYIWQMHAFVIIIKTWEFYKKLKDQVYNTQKRRYGKMDFYLFEKYKNTVIPHDKHMFQIASDMEIWKKVWKSIIKVCITTLNFFNVIVRNVNGLIFQVYNHISKIQMFSPPSIITSLKKMYMSYALSIK